jgi:hypothetical protein
MEEPVEPRSARRLLAVGIASGLIADLLFDRVAPGINVPIAVGLALVVSAVVRPAGQAIDPLDWWIPVAALLAAIGVAVRADGLVVLADLAVVGVGTLAWSVAVSSGSLTRRSMVTIATAGATASAWVAIGAARVLQVALRGRPVGSAVASGRRFLPVARGLILALPILAVFVALLGSADVAFRHLVDGLFTLPMDAEELVQRMLFATAAAWVIGGGLAIAAGLTTGLLPAPAASGLGATGVDLGEPVAGVEGRGAGEPPATSLPGAAWGATEILTVLVAVEILFAVFVAVQVAYLFGGFATVAAYGLTYSEYAREGFFQLVGVVLGAGVLLAAASAVGGGHRLFRPVAAGLVILAAVILASAALRLTLYQQAYGWTELRFHVAATMGWLAADLVLALALVLAGRVRWLLHGATMAAVATVLAVTAVGPSAFIAEQNLARAINPALVPDEGQSGLDVAYAGSLGDGAIPVLVDTLPRLDEATRSRVRALLLERLDRPSPEATAGWAAWNLERERAREALERLRRTQ